MGIIHTITEGGQIWAHRIRMLRQVCKLATTISFIAGVIVFVSLMLRLNFIIYEAVWYYLKSYTLGFLFPQIEVDSYFWATVAKERYLAEPVQVAADKVAFCTEPYVHFFLTQATNNLEITSSISFCAFTVMIFFFLIRGAIAKRRRHVSGRRLVSPWLLSWKLKITGRDSNIQIGSLPLLKGSETQHIMVTGGTGSGKTNCLHHILPKIRVNGQRCVIVDTTGTFVERYFREGKDILLNPFDKRSVSWHPWAECNTPFDFEDLAECFIPSSYSEQENYWRSAARTLFCSLMQKTHLSKRTSDLTRWVLFESLANICSYVKGTKGAAHLDMNSEKTAASVRSVTSSFLSCLEFLNDTDKPFSIRQWMQNKNDDSWLFLSCTTAQRASIRPLISCWFSIATHNLIQLSPDLSRRIWFIVDELPSLNKLKDLEVFLAESRKYGGCALLALQSMAQLETIYGREITKTIIGNCATKIAFSEQDPEIASKISRAFGEREVKEYQEGISYGAHETRDGVNLSLQAKMLPLVSVTDIQSLKRNQAFVKLPENHPITRVRLSIAKR